ncbi:hypothetical protein [Thiocystis violascens]|uniref:hypothetical protein n=1 Tax=Thiocystis violascens TaxID=73141 RepID=UPI00059DE5BE|nr:hypothetical protein [Thiocystis violascens]
MKTSFVFALVLSVLISTYIFADENIKDRYLAEKEIDEMDLRLRKAELENETLKRQVELARREQARKDRQLEYERQFQMQKIELLRLEQKRQDKKLDYEVNSGDRLLRMQERKQELIEEEDRETSEWIDNLMK